MVALEVISWIFLVLGLINAIKADTLSLVAFEIGVFGWIALSFLVLLPDEPHGTSPLFWFVMQIAIAQIHGH